MQGGRHSHNSRNQILQWAKSRPQRLSGGVQDGGTHRRSSDSRQQLRFGAVGLAPPTLRTIPPTRGKSRGIVESEAEKRHRRVGGPPPPRPGLPEYVSSDQTPGGKELGGRVPFGGGGWDIPSIKHTPPRRYGAQNSARANARKFTFSVRPPRAPDVEHAQHRNDVGVTYARCSRMGYIWTGFKIRLFGKIRT